MSKEEQQIYTETINYKFRKDSPDNYYDIEVVNNNLDKIDNTIKEVENKTKNIQSDWNIIDTNSEAFIKNKPLSLPADGGTADTIKNTLPINKGGTGAVNILDALKNLNILNNTLPNNLPLSSTLVYKDFSDFGIKSTRMFEFAALMPDYCSVIFQNDKSKSAYINDVPTDTGIIFFFKTSRHFRYALFFSNKNPDVNVYRWISNTDVLIKNWTRINDEGNALTLNNHKDTYFATSSQVTNMNNILNNKVDKVTGKGLSANDFTSIYKTKLDGIQTGAEVNIQSDWNEKNTGADAFIKNKPSSLPANGGNADTVGGKHASDFAPSGFGLGTNAKSVTGDWNNYIETGFYYGNNLLNQPPTIINDNNYWYMMCIKFDDNWCTQIAFKFNISNSIYTRRKIQTQWNEWIPIGNSFNIVNRNLLSMKYASSMHLRDISEYTSCGIGTRVNNLYNTAKVFISLNLKTNQYYTLSFVAWSKGGNQGIICDLHPDTLPEKEFIITSTPNIYTFTFISQSSDMSNCVLRFFNDQHKYVAEVCITDIKLEEGKNRTSYSLPPEDMFNIFNKSIVKTASALSSNIKNNEIVMIYE